MALDGELADLEHDAGVRGEVEEELLFAGAAPGQLGDVGWEVDVRENQRVGR